MVTKEDVLNNEFKVILSNDLYYFDDEESCLVWLSDVKKFNLKSVEFTFNTFKEALNFFNDKYLDDLNNIPCLEKGYNSIFIYDNISGEIVNAIPTIYNIDKLIPDIEEAYLYDDTKFSREQYIKFDVEWR